MQPLRIPLGGDPHSHSEAGTECYMDAPVYLNACCPNVLTMERFCPNVVVVGGETEEGSEIGKSKLIMTFVSQLSKMKLHMTMKG